MISNEPEYTKKTKLFRKPNNSFHISIPKELAWILYWDTEYWINPKFSTNMLKLVPTIKDGKYTGELKIIPSKKRALDVKTAQTYYKAVKRFNRVYKGLEKANLDLHKLVNKKTDPRDYKEGKELLRKLGEKTFRRLLNELSDSDFKKGIIPIYK